MLSSLPNTTQELMRWSWPEIEPFFQDLAARPLSASNVQEWLLDWTRLSELLQETYQRLYVEITIDTTNQDAQKRYENYLDHIYPAAQAADQKLKEKLLESGLEPPGFEIPLRNLRAEVELFQEVNLPLLTRDLKLSAEYDKIIGAQTVEWEGQETPVPQLLPVYQDLDRERRERAWRLATGRHLADRQAINELWVKFLDVRRQLAANAGYSSYRDYRWKQLLRFDYMPEDSARFHQAIEEVVVPAAKRIYEKRRQRLGVDSLRPWDLEVDPFGRPPLRPFGSDDELEHKAAAIFHRVDPQLGEYFEIMRREGLLDLDNRKGKAPGGYCTEFHAVRRPFIFMNAVGIHEDVQTLLHEGGHAFHVFETGHLPYYHQLQVGMEFAEVASMGMELLAAPYLDAGQGGFYSGKDAARARIEHLDSSIRFWPYMAVVDAFQHWVYENPEAAMQPVHCDAQWAELWDRYMIGVDWSGLEEEKITGWHRKLHIHQSPFYYIEYGLAQLGAMQVWRNARADQAQAVSAYRKALALGGTAPLPELYAAAGVKLAFDAATLKEAVDLAMQTIDELEAV